jgi:hypothetical protein
MGYRPTIPSEQIKDYSIFYFSHHGLLILTLEGGVFLPIRGVCIMWSHHP